MSYRFVLGLLVSASFISFGAGDALAKKGKGPDAMIEKAIQDSAQMPEDMSIPIIEPAKLTQEDIASPEPEPMVDNEAGFKAGPLRFLPSLGLSSGYDSNIYTTEDDEVDDYFTQVKPELSIVLEDSPHEAALTLKSDYKAYWDESDEDRHNFGAHFKSEIALSDVLSVPLAASWERTHEERKDDLDVQLSEEPLENDDWMVSGGLRIKPGALGATILGSYQDQSYEDGIAKNGGGRIVRGDADREITAGELTIDYDVSGTATALLSGRYEDRQYDQNSFEAGAYTGSNRTSEAWSAKVGMKLAYKDLKTEFYLGYADFNYDDNGVEDIQDFIASLDLHWNITDTTDIALGFNRYVFEDIEVVDPIIRNRVQAEVTQILLDDWKVSLGGGYEFMDFEGASGREDDLFDAGIGLDYMLTDRVSVGAAYEYENRDSNTTGLDYDRHIAMLRMNGKL